MIDQERRHERILVDYLRQGTGPLDLGPADSVAGLYARSDHAAGFDPDMSVAGFLRLAAEREQAAARMYEALSTHCSSPKGQALMLELSEEERKHRDWFEQRHELEVLG
jgi:rubrerythrin